MGSETLIDLVTATLASLLASTITQDVANVVWSLSTLQFENQQVLRMIHSAQSRQVGRSDLQNLANSVWSISVLELEDSPILEVLVWACCAVACNFSAQGLANMLWACGKLYISDGCVMHSTAGSS